MIAGEFKQILYDIFNVLEFSNEEKEKALETFKRKLAFELYESIKNELPQDQQEWLSRPAPDLEDPKFTEIKNTIKGMYTKDQLYEKTKPIFKKLLENYVVFMSSGLEPERVSKLNDILTRI